MSLLKNTTNVHFSRHQNTIRFLNIKFQIVEVAQNSVKFEGEDKFQPFSIQKGGKIHMYTTYLCITFA